MNDGLGQQIFHRRFEDKLSGHPSRFEERGYGCREFDEDMIEKRNAALDRSCHAHLILLHTQLDKVCLDVSVEQTIQKVALRILPVSQGVAIRRSWVARPLTDQQIRLIGLGKRTIKVVEIKGAPRFGVTTEECMLQAAPSSIHSSVVT